MNNLSTSTSELSGVSNDTLANRFQMIRQFSDVIVEPLSAEDCMVQSMPDTSPMRWHLAHTTWFFETFILKSKPGYRPFCDDFAFLFNSYYNAVGAQFPRPQRGLISRPGLDEIKEYRDHVDRQLIDLLSSDQISSEHRHAIEVGLNHEQQHQELMLTDIKHVLSCNPTLPAYQVKDFGEKALPSGSWDSFDEGVYEVGHADSGLSFDNESPRHRVLLHDFSLSPQTVTCGQFIEFIEDGGYERPDHWLSLGWTTVQENDWDAPLYWLKKDGQWMMFTLCGLVPVELDWPVCHVSYFEADAFAKWAGYRLATEFEWEIAATEIEGAQFADDLFAQNKAIHPTGGVNLSSPALIQMLGGVWEWTSSSYAPYPGYTPPAGALGEYNGKFMCNQYVLRGGSVATCRDHIRSTYRNFFPPEARWQFTGIRLAK